MTYRFGYKVAIIGALLVFLWPASYTAAQDTPESAPATTDTERVETELNQLREDLRAARTSIEDDIAEINAAQLKQIEAIEEASKDPGRELRLSKIEWGDVLAFLSLVVAAVVASINLGKYFDAHKNDHEDRVREGEAIQKEAQWKRIEFLFSQAKLFHEDTKISTIIKALGGQSQEALIEIKSALNAYVTDPTSVNARQGDILRELDHFLDRLELFSMAWTLEVLTIMEVGVFSSYLQFSIDDDIPILQRYCEEHYPLVQELARARKEYEEDRAFAQQTDAEENREPR